MCAKRFDSGELRRLARDTIEVIALDAGFPEGEWEDLATSLVRQWVTCDYNAILFPDENRQVELLPIRTPLGKPNCAIRWTECSWAAFVRDWKINPDDMPEILDQINRGQGAEVINGDGKPLRIHVDPKDRRKAVECLVPEEMPSEYKPDYEKIAADMVDEQLKDGMDIGARDELVRSIAEQWRRHDGHACIFMDEQRQLKLEFTKHKSGSNIRANKRVCDPRPYLASLGFQS